MFSSSPGRTGRGQRNSSKPAPTIPPAGPELALDQETHGRGSSMPTARYQAVKYRVLRCRGVEMERLRIEFRSKTLDSLLVNLQPAGAIRLPHRKVLEVRPSKSRPDLGLIKVRMTTLNQNREAGLVSVGNLLVPHCPK
jgi:hypothetical protein